MYIYTYQFMRREVRLDTRKTKKPHSLGPGVQKNQHRIYLHISIRKILESQLDRFGRQSIEQRDDLCCSVLQCIAVYCSVLQRVAACRSGLQWVAVGCSVLQWVALRCSALQCIAVCCSVRLTF